METNYFNIMDAECITMYSAPIWGEKDPNNPKKRLPKVSLGVYFLSFTNLFR